jgi:hypothetical protein
MNTSGDLAATFGVVGSAGNALDAEGGADGVVLVDVYGEGAAVTQDSPLEAVLHAGKLLVPVELGVRNQARVVIQESKEEYLTPLLHICGIGEVGTVHGVALPQVAEMGALKAAVGLGALLGQQLGSGSATAGELAAQGARGEAGFGDGVGGVEGEDADDGAGGAERLLAFEGLGAVEGFGGDGAAGATVGAGLGSEAVETVLLVDVLPAGERGSGDGATRGVRDVVGTAGDLLAQLALASGRVLAADERQDQGVAEEGDLGATILRIGHCGAS